MGSLRQNNNKEVTQAKLSFGLKLSKRDEFVIVDTNSLKDIDIDKDGKGDYTHGKMVEKFLKIFKPLAQVKFFQVKKHPPEYYKVNDHDLLKVLKEARDYVKAHPVKAVNLSLGNSLEIDEIKQLTGYKLKDTILSKKDRAKLQHYYRQVFEKNFSKPIPEDKELTEHEETILTSRIIKVLEDIAATGTPIFIAAGNLGKTTLNLFNLARGSHAVGSVGISDNISAFSPEHNFLEYARGEFLVNQLIINGKIAGYNLTGGFDIEITPEELSNTNKDLNHYYGQDFIGKNVQDYLISKEDFNYLKDFFDGKVEEDAHVEKIPELLEEKLFTIEQLQSLNRQMTPEEIKDLKNQGNYFSNDLRLIVKTNNQGTVTDTCRVNAMQIITGTSYATPIKMASV